MATRSKFTRETRERVIQALQVGASRRTAAQVAQIDEATLRRWMERGRGAGPETMFGKFHAAVLEAEAHPRLRALDILYREMPDRPDLAKWFVERREPGFAAERQAQTTFTGPVLIQFSFTEAVAAPALPAAEVIEGEFVEQDDEPGSA